MYNYVKLRSLKNVMGISFPPPVPSQTKMFVLNLGEVGNLWLPSGEISSDSIMITNRHRIDYAAYSRFRRENHDKSWYSRLMEHVKKSITTENGLDLQNWIENEYNWHQMKLLTYDGEMLSGNEVFLNDEKKTDQDNDKEYRNTLGEEGELILNWCTDLIIQNYKKFVGVNSEYFLRHATKWYIMLLRDEIGSSNMTE